MIGRWTKRETGVLPEAATSRSACTNHNHIIIKTIYLGLFLSYRCYNSTSHVLVVRDSDKLSFAVA